MELTPEDVTSFLESKEVNPNCPMCTKNKWSIPGVEEHIDGILNLQRREAAGISPSLQIKVVYLICENCGFVRAHAHSVVQNQGDSTE